MSKPVPNNEIAAVYCDGGVILKNPSPHGGTWAWRAIDAEGKLVAKNSGVRYSVFGAMVTNNMTEFEAAVNALEALPDGWSGKFCSDSQITLGRLFSGWKLMNLPADLTRRAGVALRRMGKIEPVLLQGHPTKAELASGVGSRHGFPVSEHNVACDLECQRLAWEYIHAIEKRLAS